MLSPGKLMSEILYRSWSLFPVVPTSDVILAPPSNKSIAIMYLRIVENATSWPDVVIKTTVGDLGRLAIGVGASAKGCTYPLIGVPWWIAPAGKAVSFNNFTDPAGGVTFDVAWRLIDA